MKNHLNCHEFLQPKLFYPSEYKMLTYKKWKMNILIQLDHLQQDLQYNT